MRREAMSSRERLQAALASKPTDRVAWSPCVDGYFLSSLPEDQKLDEAGLHRTIGSDALLRHVMVFNSPGPMQVGRSRPADNPRIEGRDRARLGAGLPGPLRDARGHAHRGVSHQPGVAEHPLVHQAQAPGASRT